MMIVHAWRTKRLLRDIGRSDEIRGHRTGYVCNIIGSSTWLTYVVLHDSDLRVRGVQIGLWGFFLGDRLHALLTCISNLSTIIQIALILLVNGSYGLRSVFGRSACSWLEDLDIVTVDLAHATWNTQDFIRILGICRICILIQIDSGCFICVKRLCCWQILI